MSDHDYKQSPEYAEFLAQLVAVTASREGRPIEQADYLQGAFGLVAASLRVANIGGESVVREHARIMRDMATTLEQGG